MGDGVQSYQKKVKQRDYEANIESRMEVMIAI
jgi:hypothetical protein